jgi:hypothetical protein
MRWALTRAPTTEERGILMKRFLGARALLVLTLFALIAIAAAGGSAQAALPSSSHASACDSKLHGPAHINGVISAVPVDACIHTSDAANGTPPLLWHNGPAMGTPSTGPVVVTPIFWDPAGHSMTGSYKSILTTYLADVAAASGQHSNVYSTLNEYYGSNGAISYQVRLGPAINDTNPLPASGCDLLPQDTTGIYADGSGYDSCIDDAQVIAETQREVTANNLPVDLGHIYVLFLAKHVETCFYAGTTATGTRNACTINHESSAVYCAYHSQASNGMVYANLSYPIYDSPVGYTCGSDARFPTIETPNGNPDADTEVSPTSHEIMEAITDPDTATGWFDSSGYENGDECAYVYGPTKGKAGSLYNQVINHHDYLTQEEFSNQNFFSTGLGCLQGE